MLSDRNQTKAIQHTVFKKKLNNKSQTKNRFSPEKKTEECG